jgi:hypothetical protein
MNMMPMYMRKDALENAALHFSNLRWISTCVRNAVYVSGVALPKPSNGKRRNLP